MSIVERLREVPAGKTRLSVSDFEFHEIREDEWSEIATYEAEEAMFMRPDSDLRLVIPVAEQFDHDGDGEQTFELEYHLLEQRNTTTVRTYLDEDRIKQEEDYDENEITVDSDEAGTLTAFYVTDYPGEIEIEISAPRGEGSVSNIVFDEATPLLFSRDQNEDAPTVSGDDVLDYVVPRNWEVQIYIKATAPFALDAETIPDGEEDVDVYASNAIIDIPVKKAQERVPDLSAAVKRHIVSS